MDTPTGILTPELLAWLRSHEGSRLLDLARELLEDPFAASKLREEHGLPLAAAAVEQVRLRRAARSKFSSAERMWFVRALLEQSSGETVAAHRSRRFAPWGRVGDLCCGLGGDALALSWHAEVLAVDRDPLARSLTEANAVALGRADRLVVRAGELPGDAPEVPAAWVDPGRREGGRRTRSLEGMSPPLEAVLDLRKRIPHLGIKLSPATDDTELELCLRGLRHERELLSVNGECKEMALWTGELAGSEPRRATLLPSGASLSGHPQPLPEVRRAGAWLLEPDAAVIRAGLVGNLAEWLQAHPIDARLAYLSAPEAPPTPFGQWYRMEGERPFSLKGLGEWLRETGASDVVIKTRGFAADPAALRQGVRRVLKQGMPGRCPVVFVTRLEGKAVMLLGERFGAAEPE